MIKKTYPVLYSLTSTGATQIWYMEQCGDSYRSTSGQIHGEKTVSNWTIAEPKNIGKINETSGEEQATSEIENKYKKQLKSGYYEKESDIHNTHSDVFWPMLAKNFLDYKDKINWSDGVLISPKLDGMRCIVTSCGMFTRGGGKIVSAPHIFETLRPFFKENPSAVFDGELYSHSLKNDFNKIISLAKKTKPSASELKESSRLLQYWIFDFPSLKLGYKDRYRGLREVILNNYRDHSSIILCRHRLIFSEEELFRYQAKYLESGFEGVMVNLPNGEYENKRSKNILKYKLFVDDEFEIVDIEEGSGNRSGMFGRAVLKVKNGKLFEANAIGNQEFYVRLLKERSELIGKMATVRYQNLTPDGIPRFGVVVAIRDYE